MHKKNTLMSMNNIDVTSIGFSNIGILHNGIPYCRICADTSSHKITEPQASVVRRLRGCIKKIIMLKFLDNPVIE